MLCIWKVILDKKSSSRIDVFRTEAPFWIVLAPSRIDHRSSWIDDLGPDIWIDQYGSVAVTASHACAGIDRRVIDPSPFIGSPLGPGKNIILLLDSSIMWNFFNQIMLEISDRTRTK